MPQEELPLVQCAIVMDGDTCIIEGTRAGLSILAQQLLQVAWNPKVCFIETVDEDFGSRRLIRLFGAASRRDEAMP